MQPHKSARLYGVKTVELYHHLAGQHYDVGQGRGCRNGFINAGFEEAQIIRRRKRDDGSLFHMPYTKMSRRIDPFS